MGATAGILVAAYFDGIATIIVETVTKKPRPPRVRVHANSWLLPLTLGLNLR